MMGHFQLLFTSLLIGFPCIVAVASKQDVYCAACESTVTEIERILMKPSTQTLEKRVRETVASICKEKTFQLYFEDSKDDAQLKEMVKGCNHLLDQHGGHIEILFRESYSEMRETKLPLQELLIRICENISKACVTKPSEKEQELEIDVDKMVDQIQDLLKLEKVKTVQPVAHKEEL